MKVLGVRREASLEVRKQHLRRGALPRKGVQDEFHNGKRRAVQPSTVAADGVLRDLHPIRKEGNAFFG